MLILDGISVISDGKLHIPFYHRGHTSLKSNTTVTLALIPPRESTESPKLTEMIVSPIEFDSWSSLWRLEATFLERPGVVNKLLTIIARDNLNILNEESSSAENRDVHTVELIIDTSLFARRHDDDWQDEQMKALERRILALCIEDLKFEGRGPRLRLKRMKGLKNAYEKFQQSRYSIRPPVLDSSVISSGYIQLPPAIKKGIGQPPLSSLLASDTKERLLRVFFLSEQDGFTYVRIAHHDSPGALETITGELVKAFDIVNSFTRIQRQGSQNEFELLLHSGEFPTPRNEKKRRAIIANLLSNSDLSWLNLRISYPRSVGSSKPRGMPPRPRKLIPFKQQEHIARVDPNFVRPNTVFVLNRRVEEYERLVQKEPSFENRQRLNELERLLAIEGEPPPHLRTFVSYDAERGDLLRVVTQKLRKRDCAVVTGFEADELEGIFRDEIITRISSCDGFLGIWTRRNNLRESPWFLWELAVAQAHKLPFRLLLQDGINPRGLRRINPEKYHYSFTHADFAGKSAEAIRKLVEHMKDKQRRSRRASDLD